MATRSRPADLGRARGRALIRDLGDELRRARLAAGLSQDHVGRVAGISGAQVGRIERAESNALSIVTASSVMAVVGLELAVRAYPHGRIVRDAAHLALIGRLRTLLGKVWDWTYEVPVGPSDSRAWDALIASPGSGMRVAIEAETRLSDVQAMLRRIALKQADSTHRPVVLLVADTRHDREVIRLASDVLSAAFPTSARVALGALRDGQPPRSDAIIRL